MRALPILAATVAILACAAVPAAATTKQPPPAGAIGNVDFVRNLPDMKGATAINFIRYHRRDVMFATGTFGLRSFDITNPRHPKLLDAVVNDDLRLAGDPPVEDPDGPADGLYKTYWQNEDMDVDKDRKLVFMARDPRSFRGTTASDTSIAGVYIIKARNPRNLKLLTFHELPTGHTTTCINGCDYLWTGGPAASNYQKAALGWTGGRPIIVTDIRDPAHPVTSPLTVDLFRNDGETAYSHDVQVDGEGIGWVSGLGGVRGYWTEGTHVDPRDGISREASATKPIPYAGGEFDPVGAGGEFMHNSFRAVGKDADDGPDAQYDPAKLILATEEDDAPPDCNGKAQFSIASLEGSYNGEGWKSTPTAPFRLDVIGTWNPHDKEGTRVDSPTSPYCSAHYFDARNGILAYSWYNQGTRFVDVSDPTNPVQVAYYRPDDGVSWAPYYHRGYVYVADHVRGVDILKLGSGARAGREVRAPKSSKRHRRLVRLASRGVKPDPLLGWMCPLVT